MSHGRAPTVDELAALRAHRSDDLAARAGVDVRTARKAKAGDAVYPLALTALVSAARELSRAESHAA